MVLLNKGCPIHPSYVSWKPPTAYEKKPGGLKHHRQAHKRKTLTPFNVHGKGARSPLIYHAPAVHQAEVHGTTEPPRTFEQSCVCATLGSSRRLRLSPQTVCLLYPFIHAVIGNLSDRQRKHTETNITERLQRLPIDVDDACSVFRVRDNKMALLLSTKRCM